MDAIELRADWTRPSTPPRIPTVQAVYIAFLQLAARIFSCLAYRFRVRGRNNVPEHGAALIVANHPSFIDAVILGGFARRPVRFVMDHKFYNTPLLHWIVRCARAIPIASRKENPTLVDQAFEEIDRALAEGEVVVIFPEGKVSRDGAMSPFRPGVERILRRRSVPVIPAALSGMWGSFFSFAHGTRPLRGRPRRFRAAVELAFGE
ncbi:MAG: 1-acyl-sn-glycerol-3-phosphate acyltransferase, partial [Myxococcota bacterium]